MTDTLATAKEAMNKESDTYKSMLGEIEQIVREVATPDLDLDQMVRKIERGYGLIKSMRGRLETTKQQVEQLRLEFEPEKA